MLDELWFSNRLIYLPFLLRTFCGLLPLQVSTSCLSETSDTPWKTEMRLLKMCKHAMLLDQFRMEFPPSKVSPLYPCSLHANIDLQAYVGSVWILLLPTSELDQVDVRFVTLCSQITTRCHDVLPTIGRSNKRIKKVKVHSFSVPQSLHKFFEIHSISLDLNQQHSRQQTNTAQFQMASQPTTSC